MAYVKLSTESVGSIVKIKINGEAKDFIVVHQGKPSSDYDSSCNGTWLLMRDAYASIPFSNDNNNAYSKSSINTYLNGAFLGLLDGSIQGKVKQVVLPNKCLNDSSTVTCKVFLLSGTEVGFSVNNMGTSGAKLDYFTAGNTANTKRVAYLNGDVCKWHLRSASTANYNDVWIVTEDGSVSYKWASDSYGIRPAFVLQSDLWISDDGTVRTNTAPAIVADSTNLGEKSSPFDFNYTVTDADNDVLTITEKLNDKTTAVRTGIASNTLLTFEHGSSADGFQCIPNGSNTIQIVASDGIENSSVNATFTKKVTSATVSLATPLAVDGDITIAVLQVNGDIPEDAIFKVEATNNANDSIPTWQDVTFEIQNKKNFVFNNETAINGAAFNFRVSVARGPSGRGGYIESISGAFQ